jgi:acetyl-CoA/propionyl-CoA carboxylase biotin carboxyl carrier protein
LVEESEATGGFYFLEMNTRVQVEHPVTEEVTGIDIVKTGIRIAAGEELPLSQRDIYWHGHAIEVRLNAEDASNDFAPSPGVVTAYEEPGGPGVRVDSSLRGPGLVAESYDPLFAKLIVSGADREEALARLGRALAEFRVEGISTTLPFYRAILDDGVFVSGNYTTGFIAGRMQSLKIEPATTGETGEVSEKRVREVEVEVNGKLFSVRVFGDEGASGGPPRRRRAQTRRASTSEGAVRAPMQGTIVKVLVEEGQEVAADEPVCILEAMKMESEVRSQKAGTVSEVRVEAGQTVSSGETLISVE